jgi:hypothetical protein
MRSINDSCALTRCSSSKKDLTVLAWACTDELSPSYHTGNILNGPESNTLHPTKRARQYMVLVQYQGYTKQSSVRVTLMASITSDLHVPRPRRPDQKQCCSSGRGAYKGQACKWQGLSPDDIRNATKQGMAPVRFVCGRCGPAKLVAVSKQSPQGSPCTCPMFVRGGDQDTGSSKPPWE